MGVSFWPRVIARVIDMVVHFLIAAGTGLMIGVMIGIIAALEHTSSHAVLTNQSHRLALFLGALLGAIAFHAICEGFHGSTPGKLLLSMVVVQEDGSPCRPRSGWIRSVSYLLDSLFFGLVGYFCMQKTPQEQRHGDEWANTVVCRRSDVAPENLRRLDRFFLVFFFAAMADTALITLGAVIRLIK